MLAGSINGGLPLPAPCHQSVAKIPPGYLAQPSKFEVGMHVCCHIALWCTSCPAAWSWDRLHRCPQAGMLHLCDASTRRCHAAAAHNITSTNNIPHVPPCRVCTVETMSWWGRCGHLRVRCRVQVRSSTALSRQLALHSMPVLSADASRAPLIPRSSMRAYRAASSILTTDYSAHPAVHNC